MTKNPIRKFIERRILNRLKFKLLSRKKQIYLYAGNLPGEDERYDRYVGLSLTAFNHNHLLHNAVYKLPLKANTVDVYQSEDVFEHIQFNELKPIINDIYRVLKVNGLFRLSLPDYRCDLLYNRSLKDDNGKILFDSEGGGDFIDGKVVNGGHLWFPVYETVKELLESTQFQKITFYHYYTELNEGVLKPIDYSKGFVMRTPDNDERVKNPRRPMSIVVDCIKQ